MKRIRLFYWLGASLMAVVLSCGTALAGSIGITLTQTSQTGAAGSTLVFDATLTNLTLSTIFLNGDSATTSSVFLTLDDSPFLNNAPLFLSPGGSSGPFAIFDVLIARNTPVGTYDFNVFTILGGLNGGALNPVGSVQFSVTVTPALAEPPTLWLILGSGLLALAIKGGWQRG